MVFTHLMYTYIFVCIYWIIIIDGTQFRVINNRILDETNRECFFHGLNVIYKSEPYLPPTDIFNANISYSKQDMQLLNSLGQNIIRLGVMWPGVEPIKGEYNITYLNLASKIISDSYNNYNICTLIDNHQDALSQALCGEGIPLWATQPQVWNFPLPLTSTPYVTDINHIPSKQDCLSQNWFNYCQSYATSSSFQRLYKNYNNLADSFAENWGFIANSFKNISGIVGFELLNEPWIGDYYNNSELIEPGIADKENLQPFYDKIAKLIYGNDSNRLIFFESANYYLDNIVTQVGFNHVPGGQIYSNKSVLSFHFYDNPTTENDYFYNRSKKGIELNSTSFMTEFNIDVTQYNQMSITMDYADKYLMSWIGWEYKPFAGSLLNGTCTGCGYGIFDINGNIQIPVVKAISRTYPQKVAGNTKNIIFDWKNNGNFNMSFIMDTSIKEPTIIYTNNKYWYQNGYDLIIKAPQNSLTYKQYDNYIEIYNTNNNEFNGEIVNVIITAKT